MKKGLEAHGFIRGRMSPDVLPQIAFRLRNLEIEDMTSFSFCWSRSKTLPRAP
jgi:hypothetical protein